MHKTPAALSRRYVCLFTTLFTNFSFLTSSESLFSTIIYYLRHPFPTPINLCTNTLHSTFNTKTTQKFNHFNISTHSSTVAPSKHIFHCHHIGYKYHLLSAPYILPPASTTKPTSDITTPLPFLLLSASCYISLFPTIYY